MAADTDNKTAVEVYQLSLKFMSKNGSNTSRDANYNSS